MKKPWALIRVPYVNPTVLGVIGPGFLNQVPTLQKPQELQTLTQKVPNISGIGISYTTTLFNMSRLT